MVVLKVFEGDDAKKCTSSKGEAMTGDRHGEVQPVARCNGEGPEVASFRRICKSVFRTQFRKSEQWILRYLVHPPRNLFVTFPRLFLFLLLDWSVARMQKCSEKRAGGKSMALLPPAFPLQESMCPSERRLYFSWRHLPPALFGRRTSYIRATHHATMNIADNWVWTCSAKLKLK